MLLVHTGSSLALLGAVSSFLLLAITALTSASELAVHGAYLSMHTLALALIVPLAFASLLSGLVLALGTRWGLFRHWWVLSKLLLTVFAVTVLLLKLGLIASAARLATEVTPPGTALRQIGLQLAVHTAGGLAVLLLPFVLSIYKPPGLTLYGWKKQQSEQLGSPVRR